MAKVPALIGLFHDALIALCAFVVPIALSRAQEASLTASVSVDTSVPLASPKQFPSFLGFNIDAASLYEGHRDGRPHRLDVKDSGLQSLAARFCTASAHGSILRIGGSAADDLAYLPSGASAEEFPNQSIHVEQDYWNEIAAFAHQSGCRLVWDLNGMSFRNQDGTWNSSNAESLLRDVVASGQQIFGLQLGNEPGHWWTRHFPDGPWGSQLGGDFHALKKMLVEVYKDSDLPIPKIFGPDVCYGQMTDTSPCANVSFFSDFLRAAAGALDGVTVHHYGLHFKPPSDCSLDHFTNPDIIFDYELEHLRKWRNAKQELAPNAQLILGETATCGDGGCPGLSNSFVAGFFNVHRLSHAAAIGYDLVFRQDLVGWSGIGDKSNYALAGPPGWVGGSGSVALAPHPDYFSSVLFKQLVGGIHLKAEYQIGWPKELSLHAACASESKQPDVDYKCGDLTLMYANVAASPVLVSDNGINFGFRREYFFFPEDGNLTSQSIYLNDGKDPLRTHDPLMGRVVNNGSTLVLPPHTYGYVVLTISSNRTQSLCGCNVDAAQGPSLEYI